MKTLIAHHVEEMWRDSLQRVGGKDLDEFIHDIYHYFKENDFDLFILTRFEDFELGHEHFPFSEFNHKVETYAYGWDQEIVLDDEHGEYTEGGSHSEYVQIQDWMYDLKHDDVSICGCFDGECIEDMEIALEHCEIPFNRIEELIV